MSGLLREHDFRLLWFGQGISALGSSVTAIVLPLIAVARLDATPFQVGLITAAGLAPWLVLGLPFGVWADRRRRRPLLIASDLGRAALLATIPIADLAGTVTIAHLVVVAMLVGALSVLFDVSYPAYLPVVVDKSRLIDANGKLSATQSAAMMGGPGLGGSLLQLAGVAVAVLVDVLSFLISALTLSAIRAAEPVPQPAAVVRRRMRTELAQGLRFTFSQPLVRALLAAGTVANFLLSGYTAVAVVFLYSTVGLGEAAIGALLAVGTAGTVVGALLAAPLVRRFGDARLILISPAVQAASGLLVPFTTTGAGLALFVTGIVGVTAGVGVFAVCARTAIQQSVPAHLLSRTMSSIQLFGRGATPLGALAGGALATVTSPRAAIATLLGGMVVPAVLVFYSPVRHVVTLAALPAPADNDRVGGPDGLDELVRGGQHPPSDQTTVPTNEARQ